MTAICEHHDLSSLNTLALPARAEYFLRLERREDLSLVRQFPKRFLMGSGSNLVLPDEISGLVIQVSLLGRRLYGEDADARYVAAAAGESWHAFVEWTLASGWPGLENLALIPGTVGATPIQNIGAYGLEIAERFHSLCLIDLDTGMERQLSAADCRFAYRDSVFKQEGWHRDGRHLIAEVVFRIPKRWRANTRYADIANALASKGIADPTPREVADAIIDIRRRKLPEPTQLPNVGSFFHNPVVDAETAHKLLSQYPNLPHYAQADGRFKLAAGWLIEAAGWKGKRLGPVGMFDKQALVLVNHGGANRLDVDNLTRAVQADVWKLFGVSLTPEPISPA